MEIRGTNIPKPPLRSVSLPRRAPARVVQQADHDEVSFGAHGRSRQILVIALQDRDEFRQLVRQFDARVVPAWMGGFITCQRLRPPPSSARSADWWKNTFRRCRIENDHVRNRQVRREWVRVG